MTVIYIYKTLFGVGVGLISPVLVLYFLSAGFSVGRLTITMAAMQLVNICTELPAGVLADRWSRRRCLTIGSGVYVISGMLLASGQPDALIGFGIAEAFVSGADTAIVFEALRERSRAPEFSRVIGNLTSLSLVAVVFGALLSGRLVSRTGYGGLFVAFVTLQLVNLIVSLTLRDPMRAPVARWVPASSRVRAAGERLVQSVRYVANRKTLVALFVLNVVVLRTCFLLERPFAQPFLRGLGCEPAEIGSAFSFLYLVAALAARVSVRRARLAVRGERGWMVVAASLGIASLLALAMARTAGVAICSMVGIYVMRGIFVPRFETAVHARVRDEYRAATLSIAKTGTNVLGVVTDPLFGWAADTWTLPRSMLGYEFVFATALAVTATFAWFVLGRQDSAEQRDAPQPT